MGFRMGPCTFDLGWLKTILVPGHHSYSRIMQKATSKDVRITVTYFWMIVSISLLMNFCTKLRTRSSDLAVLCIEPILQTGANKQLNTYHRCRQALLWRFRDSGAGYKTVDLRTCVTLHYIRVIYSGLMYWSGKTSVHMVCKTAETEPVRKKWTWKKRDKFSGREWSSEVRWHRMADYSRVSYQAPEMHDHRQWRAIQYTGFLNALWKPPLVKYTPLTAVTNRIANTSKPHSNSNL